MEKVENDPSITKVDSQPTVEVDDGQITAKLNTEQNTTIACAIDHETNTSVNDTHVAGANGPWNTRPLIKKEISSTTTPRETKDSMGLCVRPDCTKTENHYEASCLNLAEGQAYYGKKFATIALPPHPAEAYTDPDYQWPEFSTIPEGAFRKIKEVLGVCAREDCGVGEQHRAADCVKESVLADLLKKTKL